MVKNSTKNTKEKKIGFLKLKTSTFNYDLFKLKIPIKTMIMYVIINVLVVSIINSIRSVTGYSTFSAVSAFFYTILGILIISLIIYTPFYIFISSFDGKREKYWNSFLIFLTITMPFLVAGHVLNWIRAEFITISSFISSLLIVLLIYFVINLIFQLKIVFKTTAIRVLASFLLVDMLIATLAVLQYLSYLVLNI